MKDLFEEPAAIRLRKVRNRDLKAGLCPHNHGLLGRARIGLEPRFYLDRCPRCGGIWFDRGEWDRIARTRLLDNLPELWTESWQRHQRTVEAHANHLAWARQRFGPELLDELLDLARRLEKSPVRSEALAFLREASAPTESEREETETAEWSKPPNRRFNLRSASNRGLG